MYGIVELGREFGRYVRAGYRGERVDGTVFHLHCQITSALLLFASAVVSTKQFMGSPIQCLFDGFDEYSDHKRVAETFCWNNSTFTTWTEEDEERRTYHAYYQWVYFILVFQAGLFYLPKFIWEEWEGELMTNLKGNYVEDFMVLPDSDSRAVKKNGLANYVLQRLGTHRWYAIVYWCCEILCLLNVAIQVLVVDRFLGGEGRFLTYGWSALKLQESQSDLVDNVLNFPGQTVMDRIFPLQTSCTFHKYGRSGDLESAEALCFLEINIYNRYIFFFLWYWIVVLVVALISLFTFRIATMISPRLRGALLRTPGRRFFRREIHSLVDRLSFTDWWVLYSLKYNINSIFFEDLVLTLFDRLKSGLRKTSKGSDCSIERLSEDAIEVLSEDESEVPSEDAIKVPSKN